MNGLKTQKYLLAPQNKQQDIKSVWRIILAAWAGILVVFYFERTLALVVYGFSFSAVFFLLAFLSNRYRKPDDGKGWLSIYLSENKLKISDGEGLLCSKDLCDILSAEVENNQFFFIKGKSILIKSRDGDSYHMSIPGGLSAEYTAEDIVKDIQKKALAR